MKIAVFLSAQSELSPAFEAATRNFGKWIGEQGHSLVYGGAEKGMMKVIADSVRSAGGELFGVVPNILYTRGLAREDLDVSFRCADLHDRKQLLIDQSDVIVALPGGIGTIDEVFTVLGMRTIGFATPRIILFNVEGVFNSLLAMINALQNQGLLRSKQAELFEVVDSLEALIRSIEKES